MPPYMPAGSLVNSETIFKSSPKRNDVPSEHQSSPLPRAKYGGKVALRPFSQTQKSGIRNSLVALIAQCSKITNTERQMLLSEFF